jgi:hypothetical protein
MEAGKACGFFQLPYHAETAQMGQNPWSIFNSQSSIVNQMGSVQA